MNSKNTPIKIFQPTPQQTPKKLDFEVTQSLRQENLTD